MDSTTSALNACHALSLNRSNSSGYGSSSNTPTTPQASSNSSYDSSQSSTPTATTIPVATVAAMTSFYSDPVTVTETQQRQQGYYPPYPYAAGGVQNQTLQPYIYESYVGSNYQYAPNTSTPLRQTNSLNGVVHEALPAHLSKQVGSSSSSSNHNTSKPQATATPFYAQPYTTSNAVTSSYLDPYKYKLPPNKLPSQLPSASVDYFNYGNHLPTYQQQQYYAVAKSQLQDAANYQAAVAKPLSAAATSRQHANTFYGSAGSMYLDKYEKYMYGQGTLPASSLVGAPINAAAYTNAVHPTQYTADTTADSYRKSNAASTAWHWNADYVGANCRTLPTAAVAPSNAAFLPQPTNSRDPYYVHDKYGKYDKYDPYYHQQYMPAAARNFWPTATMSERLSHPSSLAHAHHYAASANSTSNGRQGCCVQPFPQQSCYYPTRGPPVTTSFASAHAQPAQHYGTASSVPSNSKYSNVNEYHLHSNKLKNSNDLYLASPFDTPTSHLSYNYASSNQRYPNAQTTVSSNAFYNDLNQPNYDSYQLPSTLPTQSQAANRTQHLPPPYSRTHGKSSLLDYRKPANPDCYINQSMAAAASYGNYNLTTHGTLGTSLYNVECAEKSAASKSQNLRNFITTWTEDEEEFANADDLSFMTNPNQTTPESVITHTELSHIEAMNPAYLGGGNQLSSTNPGTVENHLQFKSSFSTRPKIHVGITVDSAVDSSQYINLPDIIIDIEKSNNVSLPTADQQLPFGNFDVEKELDELQVKKTKLPPEKTYTSLNKPEDHVMLERPEVIMHSGDFEKVDNSLDELLMKPATDEELKNVHTFFHFARKPKINAEASVATTGESRFVNSMDNSFDNVEMVYAKSLSNDSTSQSNESTFEKEYKTFINKIGANSSDTKSIHNGAANGIDFETNFEGHDVVTDLSLPKQVAKVTDDMGAKHDFHVTDKVNEKNYIVCSTAVSKSAVVSTQNWIDQPADSQICDQKPDNESANYSTEGDIQNIKNTENIVRKSDVNNADLWGNPITSRDSTYNIVSNRYTDSKAAVANVDNWGGEESLAPDNNTLNKYPVIVNAENVPDSIIDEDNANNAIDNAACKMPNDSTCNWKHQMIEENKSDNIVSLSKTDNSTGTHDVTQEKNTGNSSENYQDNFAEHTAASDYKACALGQNVKDFSKFYKRKRKLIDEINTGDGSSGDKLPVHQQGTVSLQTVVRCNKTQRCPTKPGSQKRLAFYYKILQSLRRFQMNRNRNRSRRRWLVQQNMAKLKERHLPLIKRQSCKKYAPSHVIHYNPGTLKSLSVAMVNTQLFREYIKRSCNKKKEAQHFEVRKRAKHGVVNIIENIVLRPASNKPRCEEGTPKLPHQSLTKLGFDEVPYTKAWEDMDNNILDLSSRENHMNNLQYYKDMESHTSKFKELDQQNNKEAFPGINGNTIHSIKWMHQTNKEQPHNQLKNASLYSENSGSENSFFAHHHNSQFPKNHTENESYLTSDTNQHRPIIADTDMKHANLDNINSSDKSLETEPYCHRELSSYQEKVSPLCDHMQSHTNPVDANLRKNESNRLMDHAIKAAQNTSHHFEKVESLTNAIRCTSDKQQHSIQASAHNMPDTKWCESKLRTNMESLNTRQQIDLHADNTTESSVWQLKKLQTMGSIPENETSGMKPLEDQEPARFSMNLAENKDFRSNGVQQFTNKKITDNTDNHCENEYEVDTPRNKFGHPEDFKSPTNMDTNRRIAQNECNVEQSANNEILCHINTSENMHSKLNELLQHVETKCEDKGQEHENSQHEEVQSANSEHETESLRVAQINESPMSRKSCVLEHDSDSSSASSSSSSDTDSESDTDSDSSDDNSSASNSSKGEEHENTPMVLGDDVVKVADFVADDHSNITDNENNADDVNFLKNSITANEAGSCINEMEELKRELCEQEHQNAMCSHAVVKACDKQFHNISAVNDKEITNNDIAHLKQILDSDRDVHEADSAQIDNPNEVESVEADDGEGLLQAFEQYEKTRLLGSGAMHEDSEAAGEKTPAVSGRCREPVGAMEASAVIPTLAYLCKVALNRSCDPSDNSAVVEAQSRELTVEEALAEMYRQAGLASSSESDDYDMDEKREDVLLINLEEILDSDNDVYVLQCDMNENILQVVTHSNENSNDDHIQANEGDETMNTLQLVEILSANDYAQIEQQLQLMDGSSDRASRTDSPLLPSPVGPEYGELGDSFDLPAIHHEEIVPENYKKYEEENFFKYLHTKYVQKHVSRFYHANRILKKYKRRRTKRGLDEARKD